MQSNVPSIGDIVSIGKFYLDSRHKVTPEIKNHFIIFKSDDPNGRPGFSGVSLELALFVWSQSQDEARKQLFEITNSAVIEFHKTSEGRNQFLEEMSDTSLEKYWGLYRRLTYLIGDPERY